jgi:transcriptional regulator
MVVFQGPEAYITPSWYIETKPTTHKTVPTWDFATVHCHGVPTLHDSSRPDGDAFLSTQINDLTAQMEKSIPGKDEWTVSEAPENYIRLLKRTLYGLEIEVSRTEAKWKMSQDKPAKDIEGVQAGLRTQGEHGCIVADIVQESVEYVQSGGR